MKRMQEPQFLIPFAERLGPMKKMPGLSLAHIIPINSLCRVF